MMNKLGFQEAIPDVFKSLIKVHQSIAEIDLDQKLVHLILLRASQINQCGFCVEMHTAEARRDGETSERLDRVIVYKQVDCFSEKEKLVFEWTDALTYLKPDTDYNSLRNRLLNLYNSEEVSAITALVGMINLWNRMRISEH